MEAVEWNALTARVVRRLMTASRRHPALRWIHYPVTQGIVDPILCQGHISVREAQVLSGLIRSLRTPGPIIEIGTLFGFSTMIMAIAKEPERPLITVDSFEWNPLGLNADNQMAVARSFLKDALRNDNVTLLRQDKDEFYAAYAGPPPSLMFLDADHTYPSTLNDIHAARGLGAEVICGHDYGPGWPGVTRAVDECGGPDRLVDTFWTLPSATVA